MVLLLSLNVLFSWRSYREEGVPSSPHRFLLLQHSPQAEKSMDLKQITCCEEFLIISIVSLCDHAPKGRCNIVWFIVAAKRTHMFADWLLLQNCTESVDIVLGLKKAVGGHIVRWTNWPVTWQKQQNFALHTAGPQVHYLKFRQFHELRLFCPQHGAPGKRGL